MVTWKYNETSTKMQKDMEKVQDDLKNIIVEASSGGGAVTVKATAKKKSKK